jgi:hypothetical protein
MKTNYKEGRNNSIGKTAIALAELASFRCSCFAGLGRRWFMCQDYISGQ